MGFVKIPASYHDSAEKLPAPGPFLRQTPAPQRCFLAAMEMLDCTCRPKLEKDSPIMSFFDNDARGHSRCANKSH